MNYLILFMSERLNYIHAIGRARSHKKAIEIRDLYSKEYPLNNYAVFKDVSLNNNNKKRRKK